MFNLVWSILSCRQSPPVNKQRVSPRKVRTPERVAGSRSTESRSRLNNIESREKDLEMKRYYAVVTLTSFFLFNCEHIEF